jgi:chlorobactene lauroyltransferase
MKWRFTQNNMIPARKFPLGERLVWWLIRTSLQRHFDRVFFRIHPAWTERSEAQSRLPIIFCANHASWWDGYIAALVERHLKLDGYLMMEEPQLKRYFFFTWIGCFSVNRHNARSAMQSLQYAARLLKARSGRMVWLFPQGEIFPNDRRPLVFFSGAAHLARLASPALLYPVATRIEYRIEQHPDLYISIGEPLYVGETEIKQPSFLKDYTHHLEEHVTLELDQLRSDVLASDYTSFTQIMHGRASANRIFDKALFRKPMQRE